jgi:hypothetical protein
MTEPPVNPYAPPQSPAAPPPGIAETPFFYRPLGGFARLIVAALVAFIVADIAWVIGVRSESSLMDAIEAGSNVGQEALDEYQRRQNNLARFRGLCVLVTVVGFCLYLPRANRNARSFGLALRFTPGWSAGVFFVPIWNLYKPYYVVKELWQASERHVRVPGPDEPAPVLLTLWWGSFVTMWTITQFVKRMAAGASYRAYLEAQQYACLISIGAAVACILMVRELTARFTRRNEQLLAA